MAAQNYQYRHGNAVDDVGNRLDQSENAKRLHLRVLMAEDDAFELTKAGVLGGEPLDRRDGSDVLAEEGVDFGKPQPNFTVDEGKLSAERQNRENDEREGEQYGEG